MSNLAFSVQISFFLVVRAVNGYTVSQCSVIKKSILGSGSGAECLLFVPQKAWTSHCLSPGAGNMIDRKIIEVWPNNGCLQRCTTTPSGILREAKNGVKGQVKIRNDDWYTDCSGGGVGGGGGGEG
jgi:hypothetical protein